MIDYNILAYESVSDFSFADYEEIFRQCKTREDAMAAAKRVINELDWLAAYVADEELPEDFNQRILEEIEKEYLPEFVKAWEFFLEEES